MEIIDFYASDNKDHWLTANVSLDPAMVMVGIVPSRHSHHMVKEMGCFVVNLPKKSFKREYDYLGSKSGRDGDKFAALDLKRMLKLCLVNSFCPSSSSRDLSCLHHLVGSFAEAVKWWIGEKRKTPPEDVADDYLKPIGYEREASGNRCSRNNLEGKG